MEDRIRELAYLKWEKAGCPPGDGVNFWCEAEAEVNSGSKKGKLRIPEGEGTPIVAAPSQKKVAAKKSGGNR